MVAFAPVPEWEAPVQTCRWCRSVAVMAWLELNVSHTSCVWLGNIACGRSIETELEPKSSLIWQRGWTLGSGKEELRSVHGLDSCTVEVPSTESSVWSKWDGQENETLNLDLCLSSAREKVLPHVETEVSSLGTHRDPQEAQREPCSSMVLADSVQPDGGPCNKNTLWCTSE